MLKSLNISNFAVIRNMSINFNAGLNILTGETGAGKSIIVDALSLLTGERASTEMVRTGETIALIEGIFEVNGENAERVKAELDSVGVKVGGDEYLTIRREVQVCGRSRIFINDWNVTLITLRKLQPFLVEIHGQGEHRSLLSPQAHLLLLDEYAGCNDLRSKVTAAYKRLKKAVKELNIRGQDKEERERLQEILKFQIAEIELLDPRTGEEETLLEERKLLTYAERLNELNADAYNNLYENEGSVLTVLGSVRRAVQGLETIDKRFAPLAKALEDATISLSDVAYTLRSFAGQFEYSPMRLSAVIERIGEFEKLKRKHGGEQKDLNEIKEELVGKLHQLANWEEYQDELLKNLELIQKEYKHLAAILTANRKCVITDFEKRVMKDLRQVAMDNTLFKVVMLTSAEGDNSTFADGELVSVNPMKTLQAMNTTSLAYWTSTGADHVEFHLSANVGELARPLQSVASGGELSRLMLILRTICRAGANASLPLSGDMTLIFDEVDAGIGGRVAEAVGRRLKALAATQQVLCVTHQPQIARFADHHYSLSKHVADGRTITRITKLNQKERVIEIAKMLGLAQGVATARETSQWLLESTMEKSSKSIEKKVVGRPLKKRN